jgi:hypothetical protein
MKIERDEASTNPPDSPGWWFIEIPTRTPHIFRVTEEDIPAFRERWMDGYRCWRLSDAAENPRLEEILDGLHARPRLFFEVAQAFGRMKIAGPWVTVPSAGGEGVRHVRYLADGWPSYAAKIRAASGMKWDLELEGAHTLHDTLEEAAETADRRLANRGYHLVDLRRGG